MIPETMITFAGTFLDRADHLRSDQPALGHLLAKAQSRVVPFWHGKPLFDLTDTGPRLAWLSATDHLITSAPVAASLLGLDASGIAHFTSDVSYLAPPDEKPAEFVDKRTLDLSETRKFIDLRAVLGELHHEDAGVAASAKGLFEWRAAHRFCTVCGGPNTVGSAGWRLDCTQCERQHFPRTDPVVIMLVLDGDRALIGRAPFWPEKMYSCLAGFMEPGETIEAAVRREVMEEAGIPVDHVRYVVSQPWPFPASLMMGCVARATDTAIHLNDNELQDAIWISKADMAAALAGHSDEIAPARKGAVAQLMLQGWVDGLIPGFD